MNKSLFASFSSGKKESCFLRCCKAPTATPASMKRGTTSAGSHNPAGAQNKALQRSRRLYNISYMLVTAPAPLPQHAAGLAAAMRAEADLRAAEAGLVAALHTLILATLARLLTRLEEMVALWQAGRLPLPAPRQPRPTAPTQRCPAPIATGFNPPPETCKGARQVRLALALTSPVLAVEPSPATAAPARATERRAILPPPVIAPQPPMPAQRLCAPPCAIRRSNSYRCPLGKVCRFCYEFRSFHSVTPGPAKGRGPLETHLLQ